MATRYRDIITLRGGKAAYNIENEKGNEWTSFIPNEQFNNVLRTVIKSVRGNDIDNHKSFWINGTYGTGKSHAAAVISHLLGDDVDVLREWVDYEYGDEKHAQQRNAIYSLRKEKRLLTVKLSGLNAMAQSSDLALVLQKAVTTSLVAKHIEISVPTDFEVYINHVKKNPKIWDTLIDSNKQLFDIVADREGLIDRLQNEDLKTFRCMSNALRESRLDVRMENTSMRQWIVEVQDKLRELGTYNGLLIVWDEFTDVLIEPLGLQVLKELQEIAEKFMNQENNSFLFLISHPSAFNKLGSERMKQTDGRYHHMKYNMESVSAFKIMSRKFIVIDKERHENMCQQFYAKNPQILEVLVKTSNDPQSTKKDLLNLFPLHPGTANLATHYATVVGSSSRSVFEFLGQNDAIRDFLDSEEFFMNHDTITADYLWDYVVKVFQEETHNYGAVIERFNSCVNRVESMGSAYFAIFKGLLLLNAFNNVSGENNHGLVTPSEENIHFLFDGSRYANEINEVLEWFNKEGIIQRAPDGLFSVQFSALPSGEIEKKKDEMRKTEYKVTSEIVNFARDEKDNAMSKMMQRVIRPYRAEFYSDVEKDSSLRSQIKNARKETKPSKYFFAMLVARNNEELAKMRSFVENCVGDASEKDNDLQNIVFIVMDAIFEDRNYDRFIEYQANYACATSHGFVDQQRAYSNHAKGMVKDWLDRMARDNATIYINGQEKQPISMKHLSSVVNSSITAAIYPYGPEAHDMLRQIAPSSFWNVQNSKEMVRRVLFATSKEDFEKLSSQMRPIKYLLQDCLDDNLNWKEDTPEGHPFKTVCDRVYNIIRYADKTLPFNFDEKFSELTKPPYGLYSNFSAMAMMAFALRPSINKIFDLQGKPRDANALVDDIVILFKVWEDGKSNNKLNFKFQTPEEGKLCQGLISIFRLNGKNSAYKDVTSLKDARFAITGDFLDKRGAPLWALKYAPQSAFKDEPVVLSVTDPMKHLIDNICTICNERDLRNPALVTETLKLIGELRIDIRSVLDVQGAFTEGLRAFLRQIDLVDVKEEELDDVIKYLKENLESSVGYWTEEEVEKKARDWRLIQQKQKSYPEPPTISEDNDLEEPETSHVPTVNPEVIKKKRDKAKARVDFIFTLDEAKTILNRLCEMGDENVLDMIIEESNV